ncbi:unnamed protein product [Rhodiola kirilowii]
MEIVQKEIQKLLDADVIYPISDSQWVSPVHVVPKKSGYNQIPIAPEDQEKTTFTCPFGTFAFRRMSFGICNAPGTFQRVVTSIFSDMIGEFIEVFMDDFTIYGDTFDACLDNTKHGSGTMCLNEPRAQLRECHFMVTHGVVLGHVVSQEGIEVDKSKIDLIKTLPYPSTVRDSQSFLGHGGFLPTIHQGLLQKGVASIHSSSKEVPFEFTNACKEAFNELKKALTTTPIIQTPDWKKPFEIMCDASDFAVGAVLGQKIDKKAGVIYYASRTLDPDPTERLPPPKRNS